MCVRKPYSIHSITVQCLTSNNALMEYLHVHVPKPIKSVGQTLPQHTHIGMHTAEAVQIFASLPIFSK